MQVKKFEAKTMKEALEMVKNQLGPDAIILGARDNSKGFGLLGRSSVEVTAAVSEATLKKKQFAENKLNQIARDRLKSSPARVQKEFIEKSVSRYLNDGRLQKGITSVQYIDIKDEEAGSKTSQVNAENEQKVESLLGHYNEDSNADELVFNTLQDKARQRIKNAAKSAADIFKTSNREEPRPQSNFEIQSLKTEIQALKRFITELQASSKNVIQSHPGSEHGLPFCLSSTYEQLTHAGVSASVVLEYTKQIQKELSQEYLNKKPLVEAWMARRILQDLKISEDHFIEKYHAFLGAPGSGKTTSLVKMAAHLILNRKAKVAIVSCGMIKVGANEQIKIYAQILGVPCVVINSPIDWNRYLGSLEEYDYVLIDYPGLNLKDQVEETFIRSFLPPVFDKIDLHYVQNICMKEVDAIEITRRYQSTDFTDFIFTHLDVSINHGLILSLQKQFGSFLHSFSTGSKIPEDYELATKERVIDLIFKLTKNEQLEKLMES